MENLDKRNEKYEDHEELELDGILGNAEWTQQARNLLEGFHHFSGNESLALFVRHSHRLNTDDPKKMITLGLTEKGKEVAIKFGTNLPKDKHLRIFHSSSPRCKQTGYSILKGFQSKGGSGEIVGNFPVLYNIGGTGEFIAGEMMRYSGSGFIERWHGKVYSVENVMPFVQYCSLAFSEIRKKLAHDTERQIDVYVTHDLHLMSYRKGWFGFELKGGWTSFLGGFFLSVKGIKACLFDSVLNRFFEGKFNGGERQALPLVSLNTKKSGGDDD